jgi:2-dehydro-3-deoxyphosphogluconate aldolase / (4S)-4-hydroxy-2-oxoglutarate aldolase
MARFTRIQVALQMKESGIIPVFYNSDKEVCLSVIKACYEGGLRLFEFTNRGDFAHELFSELNKIIIKEMPEMIIGTGSVVDAGTASLYIQLGSNFIVSPVLKEEMALVCNRRKILWSPGCGSVTEISHAEELGAEIVKIFPAPSVGGPEFVKTVRGPQPWTNIMPTGGVDPTEESLKTWFDAGVYCVGMGSNLITSEILKNKDWKLLKENVTVLVSLYKKIRK